MNANYNWANDEIVVNERMKDIQREAEAVRLLHKAGLAKPGAYERAAVAFGSTLVKLGQRLQKKHAHSAQTYQTTSGKYAV
jgi:hypothetical protein